MPNCRWWWSLSRGIFQSYSPRPEELNLQMPPSRSPHDNPGSREQCLHLPFQTHVEGGTSHSLGQLEMWVARGNPGAGTLPGNMP